MVRKERRGEGRRLMPLINREGRREEGSGVDGRNASHK